MHGALNYKAVARVMGRLVGVEGLLLSIPLAVALFGREADWPGFAVATAAALAVFAVTELTTRRIRLRIRAREGFALTALVWIIFSVIGLIPFVMGPAPLSFTDALFETISGFTTTGASVYADVDGLERGILLWRALMQWIGGLGIIFFMLAAIPALNRDEGISMFHAEATGIYHTKLHPRIRQTVLSLWRVYSALTLCCILLLWAGPMSLFDAVCQTFTAISTGGFTTHNAGLAYWHSEYADWVLTIFMAVGGVNFMLLYGAIHRRFHDLAANAVARCYFGVILAFWALMALATWLQGNVEPTFRNLGLNTLEHTVSAITSTGFTVPGANQWGPAAMTLTVLLMIAGSCAGSTSGGVKIDRLMALRSNLRNNLLRTIHPHRAFVIRIGPEVLKAPVMHRIAAFFTIYMLLIALTVLVAVFCGYDFADSVFLSASAVGCNGLGYGITAAGFGSLHDVLKYVMMFDMLAGRLELFAFLTLFTPAFWRH